MKEHLRRSSPGRKTIGLSLFVLVGLLVVLAVAASGSAWAAPSQNSLLQSLPTPVPVPGPGGFEWRLYSYQSSANTGEPVWFTGRVYNSTTAAAAASAPQANITDVNAWVTINNCAIQSITVSKGTYAVTGQRVDWTVGTLAGQEMEKIDIQCTAASGGLTLGAIGTACSSAGCQSSPVTLNMGLPDIPEAGTLLLLGSGLVGVAGYIRLRMRARK
jgi:hypothetical protein